MGLIADLGKVAELTRKVIRNRIAVRDVRKRLATAPKPGRFHYRIAVYFADSDVNMYQLRQWYKPLAELASTWPVVVLCRNPTAARAVFEEGELPVAFVPTVRDLESFVYEQDLRVVLYVNQNTRNFQMFRYGQRWHVFINHGESDKMYMTTNQFKAYDFALIAGEAARRRLSRVLWDYDFAERAIQIGRPQADHYAGAMPYTPDERTVILYAPTWEGDRPSAHYGSIRTHGEALARAVLASPDHRLIYRPHPRSGVVDPAYGAANERIKAAIRAANEKDSGAAHVFDDGPDLGWQLAAADMAIVDISAMVYDRLAADKPLMVTRPVDPEAVVDRDGYLGDAEWLEARDAAEVLRRTHHILADPESVARLAHWVQHYFGDSTPGAASARFRAAIAGLMSRWEQWHTRTDGIMIREGSDEADLDDQ